MSDVLHDASHGPAKQNVVFLQGLARGVPMVKGAYIVHGDDLEGRLATARQ